MADPDRNIGCPDAALRAAADATAAARRSEILASGEKKKHERMNQRKIEREKERRK